MLRGTPASLPERSSVGLPGWGPTPGQFSCREDVPALRGWHLGPSGLCRAALLSQQNHSAPPPTLEANLLWPQQPGEALA